MVLDLLALPVCLVQWAIQDSREIKAFKALLERQDSLVPLVIWVHREQLAGLGLLVRPAYKVQLVLRVHLEPRVQLGSKDSLVQQAALDRSGLSVSQVPLDWLDSLVQVDHQEL